MIDWYASRNWWPVRQALKEIRASRYETSMSSVTDAIAYFNRERNNEMIRDAMKRRFGIALIPGESLTDDSGSYVSRQGYYKRSAFSDAIDVGMIENIDTGTGIKVIQTLATLSTQQDQSWTWVDKTAPKQENIYDVSQLVGEVRERGGFATAFTELDMAACMVESALFHIYYDGDLITYDVVTRDKVWIYFGRSIELRAEGEQPKSKNVDFRKLEDASAVIVLIATGSDDESMTKSMTPEFNRYMAYVGSCTDFEDGRFVTYEARKPWPIPEPYPQDRGSIREKGAILYEHMIDGKPCNPLSWLQNHGTPEERDLVTTEYPFVIWRAGHRAISNSIMPITTSLYESCIEIEIAMSRLLKAALDGARGMQVISLSKSNSKLPTNLDIPVISEGDSITQNGWPAGHAQSGIDVLLKITEQTVGSFNVPGYAVIGQLGGMNPQSGVALMIQTQPLITFRNRRISLNRDGARRIWEIERALLALGYPSETRGLLNPSIVQQWDPGRWELPEPKLEKVQGVTQAMDARLEDYVGAIQEWHGLPTEAAALELIDRMKARDPEFDPAYQAKQKQMEVQQNAVRNQEDKKGREEEEVDTEDVTE
jgi:hypothetical protein